MLSKHSRMKDQKSVGNEDFKQHRNEESRIGYALSMPCPVVHVSPTDVSFRYSDTGPPSPQAELSHGRDPGMWPGTSTSSVATARHFKPALRCDLTSQCFLGPEAGLHPVQLLREHHQQS
ncbi:hypothetical protein UY3_17424 [Chelonia mydas]|uniref:Uncharacterized protein n=1 Tax=Chelonia mydas TaxID=8469 RepID=M7B0A5_CHEMY|nr:hypothetical protein UY3_17424 [Chelonia mydas]